jgi:hypothetical protein
MRALLVILMLLTLRQVTADEITLSYQVQEDVPDYESIPDFAYQLPEYIIIGGEYWKVENNEVLKGGLYGKTM